MVETNHSRFALIVAGGSGQRMVASIPKQFLLLKEKPVLMHTLQAFFNTGVNRIFLVLPLAHFDTWRNLCSEYDFNIPHELVEGGSTRFKSVSNGLRAIGNHVALVAIHDGVRPLVSQTLIERCFSEAAIHGNALAVVPSKDSLRMKKGEENLSVNRTDYVLVQTPQTFDLSKIQEAYLQPERDTFTDDASVFEASRGKIHLVEGEYSNLKITTPEDLKIAEALMA